MKGLGSFNDMLVSGSAAFYDKFFDTLGEKITAFGERKFASLLAGGTRFFVALNRVGMNTRVIGGVIRSVGLRGMKAHWWTADQLKAITEVLGKNLGRVAKGIGIAGAVFDFTTAAIEEWNDDPGDSTPARASKSALMGGFTAGGAWAGASGLAALCSPTVIATPVCGFIGGAAGGFLGGLAGREILDEGVPAVRHWWHGFENSVAATAFHGFW